MVSASETFMSPLTRARKALGVIDVNSTALADQLKTLSLNDEDDNNVLSSVKKVTTKEVSQYRARKDVCSLAPNSKDENDVAQAFRYVCLNKSSDEFDEDMKPWSIDDFEYIEKLGKGGTAHVYRVKEKQSGYECALKVQKATDDAFCEVDIHDTFHHPCIVRMFDYFQSEQPVGPMQEEESCDDSYDEDKDEDDSAMSEPKKYLIMILELCSESLFDAVRDAEHGYLQEEQGASYFRNMIDAIEYLHDEDIIHCDCKSMNFLLSRDRQHVKLADFGMSVREDEKIIVGGSPIYMSPEHLKAFKHFTDNFDHTSDIYSLGIVLYELLVGFLPYEVIQDDEDSVLVEAMHENGGLPVLDLRNLDDEGSEIYVPPPIFPDFISNEAQDLIMSLTEFNPKDRITLQQAKKHPWFQKFGIHGQSS
jgi:aurora kinase